MNGIHDMGGMHGFGRVPYDEGDPLFHQAWQGRIFGMLNLVSGAGLGNVDEFRHAIERMPPDRYLTAGYYGRWMFALETMLVEHGITTRQELAERCAAVEAGELPTRAVVDSPVRLEPGPGTAFRAIDRQPRFEVADEVLTVDWNPAGHTRLPRYARGKLGRVVQAYGSCVYPDSNAHHRGEDPQYLYCVQFDGEELWGQDAEPHSKVALDLFEPYLIPLGPESVED